MNKMMLLFTAVFLALQLVPSGTEASGGRELLVTGVVINIAADSIEIKRGSREFVLHFGEGTVFNDLAGAVAASGALEICQTVRARYVRQGDRNVLVNVRIVNASHCYQN